MPLYNYTNNGQHRGLLLQREPAALTYKQNACFPGGTDFPAKSEKEANYASQETVTPPQFQRSVFIGPLAVQRAWASTPNQNWSTHDRGHTHARSQGVFGVSHALGNIKNLTALLNWQVNRALTGDSAAFVITSSQIGGRGGGKRSYPWMKRR